MNIILLGNIICLIGSLTMVVLGLIKHKKRFLLFQCVSTGFFAVGALLLGGITGTIVDVANIVRNLLAVRWRITRAMKLGFIVVVVGCSFLFGDNTVFSWLPVLAGCLYTWFIDTENMVLLKVVFAVTTVLWLVFDLSIHNYATVIFDFLTIVTSCVSIVSLLKERKNKPLM